MNATNLPDLTFPHVEYGPLETAWNLSPLLYRNGARINARAVSDVIDKGALGAPVTERLPLVERLHEEIAAIPNRSSATDAIRKLRSFYAWADEAGRSPTLESVENDFICWTDHLLHRVRVKKDLTRESACAYAYKLSTLIAGALGLHHGLVAKTRLYARQHKKDVLGTQADKQRLDEAFAFGHAMIDIASALTAEAIYGPPPVKILFRSGESIEYWYGIREPQKVKSLAFVGLPNVFQQMRTIRNRENWIADKSHRTRYAVINLRVECEMLIFIAQTGMNLSQVKSLRTGKFRFQSHLDGYRIYRTYKGRRGGEVEFEIYSEYRRFFEAYLSWRNEMFPDEENGLLFPRALQPGKSRPPHATTYWDGAQKICDRIGVKFIGPRTLRKTRVNWLLRRLHDPLITSQMAQHSQETLLRSYDLPNHQAAAFEISRFHASSDPAISMPGAGICIDATPSADQSAPSHAPSPDCISPAGCLFCEQQRDIDSADHLWSLASYRHLKSVELSQYKLQARSTSTHPAMAAIERVTEKLKLIEASSAVRALWVTEALARIDEGDYHPKWEGFIALAEARKCQ